MGGDIDGEGAGDHSGHSVSLSADGSTVAVGAAYNDGAVSSAGHVRVFNLQSGTWVQVGADIDGEESSEISGWSVSLAADGNTVAIAAPYNDAGGVNGAGRVRVYGFQSESWVRVGDDIDGQYAADNSGWSVSLSEDGNTIAIGTPFSDIFDASAGHVRVFKLQSGSWIQVGDDIYGEAAGDQSGYSVSLSAAGNVVAIGARYNDGSAYAAGHVRVYVLQSGSWWQKGGDIDGEAQYDNSGYSVSLSADGDTVAVGAYQNDGNGTGAGHVRVYNMQGESWVQVGLDIDGEAAGDWSGHSVSLSGNGDTVAVGAIYNDGSAGSAGHVRVYKLRSGMWVQEGVDIDGEAEIDYSGYSVIVVISDIDVS